MDPMGTAVVARRAPAIVTISPEGGCRPPPAMLTRDGPSGRVRERGEGEGSRADAAGPGTVAVAGYSLFPVPYSLQFA